MPDFKTSDDGDLVIEGGRLAFTADEGETAKQNLIFRLQTDVFDYSPDPDIGAGLHRYAGQPNTRRTASDVERTIQEALARDSRFPPGSVRVEAVPLSSHVLGVYVFHAPPFVGVFTPVTVAFTLDLTVGEISFITG